MNRTFNNGIGMVVVVSAAQADAVAATLRAAGEAVYAIGAIALLYEQKLLLRLY
jgi:phosphoribosylformylglycinamidine cyclo-ligase